MHRAVTDHAPEAELLAAFRETTLMLFAQEGLYTVTENDGSRYVPAFTHPSHAPDTWHLAPRATNSRPPGSRCGSTRGTASA